MKDTISLDNNVLFRRVIDEGVVVDQRKAQVMVVNEVGIRVLELIRKLGSVEDIANVIAAEFDAPPEVIREDVRRFVEKINDCDLTGNS